MGNVLTFYSSGNKVNVKWINDDELDDFVAYVNDRMQSKTINETTIDSEEQNIKKIKQLKELLDMGAITQEEFDIKKTQLLGL